MTTTKTAAPSVRELANRQRQLLAAAEEICLAIADGAPVNDSEAAMIFDGLGWDRRRINREKSRAVGVRDHQKLAGDSRQRADASERLRSLRESVPVEIEGLDAEIAILEKRRAQLASSLTDAEAAVARQRASVERLREMAPAHVRAEYDQAVARLNATEVAIEMRSSAARLEMIRNVLNSVDNPGQQNRFDALGHCKAAAPELVVQTVSGGYVREMVPRSDWETYVADLRFELPNLEDRVADLRERVQSSQSEIEKTLDLYAR